MTITVSKGRQQVDVPDVVGPDARPTRAARCSGAGLGVTVRERTTDDRGRGRQGARPAARRRRARWTRAARWSSIVGQFEAADQPTTPRRPTTPAAAASEGRRAGRRPLERARGLAGVRRGRARRPGRGGPRAGRRADLARDGRWTCDGEPVALEPGGGLLGADVGFPVLHGPVRRGRHGAGAARAARRALRGRRRAGVGRVHGQGRCSRT